MNPAIRQARDVLDLFELGGTVDEIEPCGTGHINDTYIAVTRAHTGIRRYTLQRINGAVFPRPDLVMHNIGLITGSTGTKHGNVRDGKVLPVLTLVPTEGGEPFHRDDTGAYWRCYRYVEGITYDRAPEGAKGLSVAREAARAFGRFTEYLNGLGADRLHVTIEDFHNTPARFARLHEVIAADPCGRVASVGREIDAALPCEDRCGAIAGPLGGGEIPLRAAHNDTKINNVVFDDGRPDQPRALCVIDLDTVMPGSPLFDFGDLVRSSVCRRPEDETDLEAVRVDPGLFESVAGGFLDQSEGCGRSLTRSERELLVTACLVITLETGVRFLTDHLSGDVYFRIKRPGHNLDRARAQFRLLAEMEKERRTLERIVKETLQW